MKAKIQKRAKKKEKATSLATLLMTSILILSLTACGDSSEEMIKELADNAGMEVEEVEKDEEPVEEEPSKKEAAEESAVEESDVEESNSEKEADEYFEEEKAVETVKGVHIEIVGDTLYISGTGSVEMRDTDKFWKEYYQNLDDDTQCEPIVNIVVEEGITAIRDNAFFGSLYDVTSISLPDGLTYIGTRVFDCCTNLPSITFPDGLTSIGEAAFKNAKSLTSVTFPEGLTYIGIEAFAGCGLTSVSFPDSLKTIYPWAFKGCKFTSITLPDGFEGASYYSFMGCKNLEEVTFGTGLQFVHDCKQLGHIFTGCDSLKRINAPESSRKLFEEAGYDLSIFEWY